MKLVKGMVIFGSGIVGGCCLTITVMKHALLDSIKNGCVIHKDGKTIIVQETLSTDRGIHFATVFDRDTIKK